MNLPKYNHINKPETNRKLNYNNFDNLKSETNYNRYLIELSSKIVVIGFVFIFIIMIIGFILSYNYYSVWYYIGSFIKTNMNVVIGGSLNSNNGIFNAINSNLMDINTASILKLKSKTGNVNINGNMTFTGKDGILFEDPYIIKIENGMLSLSPYSRNENNEIVIPQIGFKLDSNGTSYFDNIVLSSNSKINAENGIFDIVNATRAIIGGIELENNTIKIKGDLELIGNNTISATRNGIRTTVFNHVTNLVRYLTTNLTSPLVKGNLTLVQGDISLTGNLYISPMDDGLYIFSNTVFGLFQDFQGRVGIGTNILSSLFTVYGDISSMGLKNVNGISNQGGITNIGNINNDGNITTNSVTANIANISNIQSDDISTINVNSTNINSNILNTNSLSTKNITIKETIIIKDETIDHKIFKAITSKVDYFGGYVTGIGSTFSDVGGFIYKGKSSGFIIKNMTLLYSNGNPLATIEFQVLDVTNTKTIAFISYASGTTNKISLGLGSLSNIPFYNSIIIFQLRRSIGNGAVNFYSIMVEYE